jgi:hypothetical protein
LGDVDSIMARDCSLRIACGLGLALLALTCPLLARPALAGEQLFVGIPNGWDEAWRQEHASQTIVEYLPTGQSVSDWSEMITLQEFPGTQVDPMGYLQKVVAAFGEGCQATRHEGPRASVENGYPVALAYMECKGPDPTKAAPGVVLKNVEFLAIKAIQGVKSLDVVQRAWHGDDETQHPLQQPTAKDWVAVVRDAELCDLADNARTCRTIGRTGGLTE